MEFGRLLRKYRLRAGWTQEQLAEHSGVSVHAISVLESGRRPPRAQPVLAARLEDAEPLLALAELEPDRYAGLVVLYRV